MPAIYLEGGGNFKRPCAQGLLLVGLRKPYDEGLKPTLTA